MKFFYFTLCFSLLAMRFCSYSYANPPERLYLYVSGGDTLDSTKYFNGVPKPPGDDADLIVKISSTPKLRRNGPRILSASHQGAITQMATEIMAELSRVVTPARTIYHYIYTVVPTDRFYSVLTALNAVTADQATPAARELARSAQGIVNTQPQVADEYLTNEAIPANTIVSVEVWRLRSDGEVDLVESVSNPAAANPPSPAVNAGIYPVRAQEGVFHRLVRGARRYLLPPGATRPVANETQRLLAAELLNPDLQDDIPASEQAGCSSASALALSLARAEVSLDACLTMEEYYPLARPQATALSGATSFLLN